MSVEMSGAGSATSDDLDLFVEPSGTSTETASNVPAKYAGKSIEDLIQMHQHSERKITEQGREVGTLRRMADEILNLKSGKQETTQHQKVERQPVTVESLLNDPEKAIRSAVDSSEAVQRAKAAEQRAENLERSITQRDFVSRYPTYADDMQDPAFTEWVKKNEVRAGLGNLAANNDFRAAASLWDMWTEHKELAEPKGEKKVQKKVASSVRSTPATQATEKVWSRAKLMELRMKIDYDQAAQARWNDPKFQEEMNKAYAEGRVK